MSIRAEIWQPMQICKDRRDVFVFAGVGDGARETIYFGDAEVWQETRPSYQVSSK